MSPRLPPAVDLAPMEPPVTVVGDVHLTPERPDVAARFAAFLETVVPGNGTLVLLGDLFDWWVGREQARRQPFAGQVIDHLVAVSERGTRLAFLSGNRDFLFDGVEGLDLGLWPDVVRTTWGTRRVVLSHGDLLCSADRGYLRMRALFRSAGMQALHRVLPYGATAYLAEGLRDLSERSVRRSPGAQLGLDYDLARAWLDGYEADTLVTGHVHTGVHHRLAGAMPRDVYVLKDWHEQGSVVRFDEEGIRLEDAILQSQHGVDTKQP